MTSEYKGITNDQAAFAALGVFDGVHTGHRAVIEKVKEEAAMRNLSSAVISFRTHPQQVLHPEIPFRMLTSSAMTIVSGITGPRVSKSTSNMART